MDNVRLERIEKMLQITLEAICSLAQKTTGQTMLVGNFDNCDAIGAGPRSESVNWVE